MIPCKNLWMRLKLYLDSLPDDEVVPGIEAARAIGSSRASLNGNLDYEVPEIAKRTLLVTTHGQRGTPQKRVFGNPRAIKELRRKLENQTSSYRFDSSGQKESRFSLAGVDRSC